MKYLLVVMYLIGGTRSAPSQSIYVKQERKPAAARQLAIGDGIVANGIADPVTGLPKNMASATVEFVLARLEKIEPAARSKHAMKGLIVKGRRNVSRVDALRCFTFHTGQDDTIEFSGAYSDIENSTRTWKKRSQSEATDFDTSQCLQIGFAMASTSGCLRN